jgi:hypothetical protein
MSDFYPALSRAVAKLAIDDAQSRQGLYEHARKFLIFELQQQRPQRLASEIIREQAALERAILLVEERLKRENSPPRTEALSVRLAADRGAMLDSAATSGTMTRQERPIAEGDKPGVRIPMERQLERSVSVESKVGSPRMRGGLSRAEIERPKRPAYRDPTLIMLACVVAVFCFTAVTSIPVAAIYAPRLVWFVEHLVDNPRLIILIATVLGALLLLFLPIFGSTRKRTAFGFFWQLVLSNIESVT